MLLWAETTLEESGDPEALVVVVSSQSTVIVLPREHIADLFLGRTLLFPNGELAVPIDQAEGSGIRERFNSEVLERTASQVRTYWSRLLFTGRGRPPRSVSSSEEVLRVIASDPRAIGYVERRHLNGSVRVVFEE